MLNKKIMNNMIHVTDLEQKLEVKAEIENLKKGGGNYAYHHLKNDIGVYVCAFLNSEEEGTLFIGVNDEGIVEGITCDHRTEDNIRKDIIDPGIKAIKPEMFPENYTVKFTPVCHENNRQIGNLKVIEITVKKVEQLTQLYEVFNGEIYIRRDGSKQGPLKANQIQEWHNQKNNRFMQQRIKSAKIRGERDTGQYVAILEEKDRRIKEKEDMIKEKEDRIKEKEERIKEKEEKIQSLEKQNNEMARAKSRLGHRIDDKEKKMEEEKNTLKQKMEEEKKILEQKMEEEKEILGQKMEEDKKVLEQKMEEEKKTLEQKISNMEKREKKFNQHIFNLKKDIKKFEEQHNRTTEDKAALEQRITVNEQEKIELARRIEGLENEKMRLEHQIENTKNEVEKSKNMSSSVDEERKMLEQHVEDMNLKMKQLEEDIDTTEEEKSSLQQNNDDMRLENKSMEEKVKKKNKENTRRTKQ